ncbi:hypothetical protein GCM10023149_42190 [Mucilaginibacter gynuensis]|uniref:DUF1835 domain-containing protein n=1 Tax=Mucilaginibacter gynuensis TaxID=1302236 RepID=A0ABP8H684_9SPHI
MANILHVLNGDSTWNGFKQTGIDGDTLIWREVFSEGPLFNDVSSAAFWEARKAWITETFNTTPEAYQHDVVDQLGKLNEPYDEINLWFEFDLHCQVNLLGVMMLLEQMTNMSAPAVYLISPDSFPGKDDFAGMGELNGSQLEFLYDNIRVQLTEYDFSLATEAWQTYLSGNAALLTEWLDGISFWGNLHLLGPALQAHLKRLQLNKSGLNYIEQKLVGIYHSGITTKPEIYKAFWIAEKIYGMGDTELDIYLDSLGKRNLI